MSQPLEPTEPDLGQTQLFGFELQRMQLTTPLPPPAMLREYEMLLPGIGERMIRRWEIESEHRHDIERHIVHSETSRQHLGQILGFVIALVGLGVALLLSLTGHDAVGAIIGGADIAGLAAVFVIGRRTVPDPSE